MCCESGGHEGRRGSVASGRLRDRLGGRGARRRGRGRPRRGREGDEAPSHRPASTQCITWMMRRTRSLSRRAPRVPASRRCAYDCGRLPSASRRTTTTTTDPRRVLRPTAGDAVDPYTAYGAVDDRARDEDATCAGGTHRRSRATQRDGSGAGGGRRARGTEHPPPARDEPSSPRDRVTALPPRRDVTVPSAPPGECTHVTSSGVSLQTKVEQRLELKRRGTEIDARLRPPRASRNPDFLGRGDALTWTIEAQTSQRTSSIPRDTTRRSITTG